MVHQASFLAYELGTGNPVIAGESTGQDDDAQASYPAPCRWYPLQDNLIR